MPNLPKLIDNKRATLSDLLISLAPEHTHLSIATGYWDLPGIMLILDKIRFYKSIRILIGQEPLSPRRARNLKTDKPDEDFPELDFAFDLAIPDNIKQADELRQTITDIKRLINDGIMEVKIYRKEFLHAKAYIFGDYTDTEAIGIVGSANFTKKGLTVNRELNSLEDENRIVRYKPTTPADSHGHLSWFDEVWVEAELWNGKFTETLEDSPVGDLTFGAYDVYIKTLMEVFPDELIPKPELEDDIKDVLYSFQNRNAGILINKLERMGVAMLSDSVGLGKTITAGAVIKHYLERGKKRIIVITPASLKNQWVEELAEHFNLIKGNGYEIVSQQNLEDMENLALIDKYKSVDLFVIDEAHNLRNTASTRHNAILDWFSNNIESKVLLLTATPINNSLMDFANQIQLGLKGSLDSVSVPYMRNDGKLEVVDFFEALKRIQGEIRQAERAGKKDFDWKKYKPTFTKGLSHYLVRSTRQGVEAEGGIVQKDGTKRSFPTSVVQKINHQSLQKSISIVDTEIENNYKSVLEDIDSRTLNPDVLTSLTQQSLHPLDFIKNAKDDELYLQSQFDLEDCDDTNIFIPKITGVVPNIFQLVNMLGWTPYRALVYKHSYYGKSVEQIRALGLKGEEAAKTRIQFVIHNMLHITWLKRLESSSASLLKSVEYYQKRLSLFEKYLNLGYIVSLGDALTLESDEYSDDIDKAFSDYGEYLADVEKALDNNESPDSIKKRGVEKIVADSKIFNIGQLKTDIGRDKKIIALLINTLTKLIDPLLDDKLQQFVKYIESALTENKYGKKVLVFSYFADTIDYLQEAIPKIIKIQNFEERSAFITGQTQKAEHIVRRFAPKAKKYELKSDEKEIDFLFATDVLSEGQNLQDAGMLINYDLHWNPVRMIQRNGRINRLGSDYKNVLIGNATPQDNLELYLRLVKRLETKIETIRNTIGTDQSVLGEEENPIEFIESFYNATDKDAAAKMDKFDDDDDILSWTNDFVADLRLFLSENENNQNEMERVRSMPLGKWNYLPRTDKLFDKANDEIYALTKAKGITSITGHDIMDTYFIKVNTNGEYPAQFIEEIIALSKIKADPKDNERLLDKIDVDRQRVNNRAIRLAKTKASGQATRYEFKPSQENALKILQKNFSPSDDLMGTLATGIKNAKHERVLKKILNQVNREVKERGSLFASTINEFTKLLNEIRQITIEDRTIESVEGVLFYASK
ncbi:MAG: phospholipase D-like domain-containing protein [Bacteroidales bacterium]|jgi:ERCC4-related helicase|nr:phospholipase D-like domain-containing protein [Bacteroidales bacterium]